jgi:hypothetical protein
MTFRLSEVPTALSTQEKSTLFPQRDEHHILGNRLSGGDDSMVHLAEYGGGRKSTGAKLAAEKVCLEKQPSAAKTKFITQQLCTA